MTLQSSKSVVGRMKKGWIRENPYCIKYEIIQWSRTRKKSNRECAGKRFVFPQRGSISLTLSDWYLYLFISLCYYYKGNKEANTIVSSIGLQADISMYETVKTLFTLWQFIDPNHSFYWGYDNVYVNNYTILHITVLVNKMQWIMLPCLSCILSILVIVNSLTEIENDQYEVLSKPCNDIFKCIANDLISRANVIDEACNWTSLCCPGRPINKRNSSSSIWQIKHSN